MQHLHNLIPERNTVVIKIGTNLLADKTRGIDTGRLEAIARSVSAIRAEGRNVAIVSSGAIGAGVAALGMKERPRTIPEKQATAAIGQPLLMEAYENAFRKQNLQIAQLLLTKDDFANRSRYVNARNTFSALFGKGVVPVVNENDTVAVEEIKLGDNDNLSAMVATLVEAAILIILSDVDGLYTADPSRDPNAEPVRVVEKITPQIERYARRTGSELSTGGMATKIQAAKRCVGSGIAVVITNGTKTGAIEGVFNGEIAGTVFLPSARKLSMRKQWIGFVSHTNGSIVVDDGARNALVKKQTSLLPSGITEVRGNFKARDIVSIVDPSGNQIGKGITGYSSTDLNKIKGKRSSEIESILHRKSPAEVIHRDNLAPVGE
jgi:glutamate 5-kinase